MLGQEKTPVSWAAVRGSRVDAGCYARAGASAASTRFPITTSFPGACITLDGSLRTGHRSNSGLRTPRCEDGQVSPSVEPQHSVILVVGREQFTPPKTFGGEACTATHDCVAIGVRSVEDGPTDVTISPEAGTAALVRLGEFQVETEGLLSVRSVYNKEYDAMGVRPGHASVTIWGNTDSEPSEVLVQVAVSEETWLDAP